MKKIHLICNAHLDPVWLWRWEEGCTEALSTFRTAERFTDEFPGFTFNHNEAILYQWVKENEPDLYERIKEKVKEGSWKIMGGWYLQPDCNMPSGGIHNPEYCGGQAVFYGGIRKASHNGD